MSTSGAIRAGRAYVELLADDTKFAKGLKAAEVKLRVWSDSIVGLGAKMMGAGLALSAPAIAAAKVFSSSGDAIAKMARRTGLGVEALSELQFAASQSGTDIGTLERSIKWMQKSLSGAADQAEGTTGKLDALGISAKDLVGLAPEQQFVAIAEALSRISDPTERAAAALGVFGRSGTDLLPMVARGASGIEDLRQKARDLGLTIGTQAAASAERLNDALDALHRTTGKATSELGAALAPAMTNVANAAAGAMVKIKGVIEGHTNAVAAIAGTGAALAAAGLGLSSIGRLSVGLVAVSKAVATIGLTSGTAAASIAALGAGIAAFAMGPQISDWFQKGAETADEAAARIAELRATMDRLLTPLSAFAERQGLANEEMTQAAKIIDELAKKYGVLGASIDQAGGKVNGLPLAAALAADKIAAEKALAARNALADISAEQLRLVDQMNDARTEGGRKAARERFQENIPKLMAARGALATAKSEQVLTAKDVVAAQAGRPTRAQTAAAEARARTEEGARMAAVAKEMTARGEWEKKAADELHNAKVAAIENEALREAETINGKYARERAEGEKVGADLTAIDRAREVALAALHKRTEAERLSAARETAKKAEQDEKRLAENRVQLEYDIAKARIEATMEGHAKEVALLGIEQRRALDEAREAGLDSGRVNELFALKRAAIDTTGESKYSASVAGTFSGFAAGRMGASNPLIDLAMSSKETVRLLRLIEQKRLAWGVE